jgi:Smg protein
MKTEVLEALLFIFDTCVDEETGAMAQDIAIEASLNEVGFSDQETTKAMAWIDGLAQWRINTDELELNPKSIRILSPSEQKVLPLECINYIYELERLGILAAVSREIVIDRAVALAMDEALDIEKIRWIAMVVLFNSANQQDVFALMEFNDGNWTAH